MYGGAGRGCNLTFEGYWKRCETFEIGDEVFEMFIIDRAAIEVIVDSPVVRYPSVGIGYCGTFNRLSGPMIEK